jgi:hypothetical protein
MDLIVSFTKYPKEPIVWQMHQSKAGCPDRPKFNPTHFCQNLYITCTVEKVAKHRTTSVVFKSPPKIEKTPKRRKFAKSGTDVMI